MDGKSRKREGRQLSVQMDFGELEPSSDLDLSYDIQDSVFCPLELLHPVLLNHIYPNLSSCDLFLLPGFPDLSSCVLRDCSAAAFAASPRSTICCPVLSSVFVSDVQNPSF